MGIGHLAAARRDADGVVARPETATAPVDRRYRRIVGVTELGPWEPIAVDEAIELFRPAAFRWWLSGGHALEAHLGRSWRGHDDTDIGISRSDAPRLLDVLGGWDIHVGAAGVLTPWAGDRLDPARSQNNLWCRPTPDSAWMIDVTVGDGDERQWIYRRDARIRRPWDRALLSTAGGVPYLAPELQLLFKSANVRPKDELDASTVIPVLESERRSWLAAQLPAEHPWHEMCRDGA